MPSTRRPALAFVLVFAVVAVVVAAGGSVAPATARMPPTPVCGVCSGELDRAAADRGVAVDRGDSSLVVDVGADGSTTWTATVELERGTDALENESLRRDVVAEATRRSVADPTAIESTLDGDVLRVTYRDPTAAATHAGALVFLPLDPEEPSMPFVGGGEGPRYLGADTVTLRGPTGYRVYGDYAGAAESGLRVTWTGSEAETDVEGEPRVVFVRQGTWFPGLRAWLARTLA